MRVATAATVCFPMAICVYYVEVAAAVVVAFAICFATDTRYNIQDTNMWGGEWEWEKIKAPSSAVVSAEPAAEHPLSAHTAVVQWFRRVIS